MARNGRGGGGGGGRAGGGAAVKSRQFAIEFASDFPKPRLPRRCGTETTWVNLCEKLSSCLRVEGSPSFPLFPSRAEEKQRAYRAPAFLDLAAPSRLQLHGMSGVCVLLLGAICHEIDITVSRDPANRGHAKGKTGPRGLLVYPPSG